MSFMNWNENLSVGINSIDDQHKKLVSMINELHGAMGQGKGSEALKEILSQLIEYTKSHFTNEETLMAKHGYPKYQTHKSSHSMLTEKVMDLELELKSGKIALSVQVFNFLKDWLVNHIQREDKEYVPFLLVKGCHNPSLSAQLVIHLS